MANIEPVEAYERGPSNMGPIPKPMMNSDNPKVATIFEQWNSSVICP